MEANVHSKNAGRRHSPLQAPPVVLAALDATPGTQILPSFAVMLKPKSRFRSRFLEFTLNSSGLSIILRNRKQNPDVNCSDNQNTPKLHRMYFWHAPMRGQSDLKLSKMVNPSVLWDSIERWALSKSIDTAATVNKGLFGVSQLYTVSKAPSANLRRGTCQGSRAIMSHHDASSHDPHFHGIWWMLANQRAGKHNSAE